jgi:hypothetical protein
MRYLFLFLLSFFVLSSPVQILASTAYAEAVSQTFTKNGNTYVTTKTIVNDQITIVTKIYDSSGNLIDTKTVNKTVTNPPTKEITYPVKNPTLIPSKPQVIPTLPPTVSPTPTPVPQNNFTVKSDSLLTVDPETGKISLDTENGSLQFNTTPEQIMANAAVAGLKIVNELKLTAKTAGGFAYQVTGTKQEKLLTLFQVKLPTVLIYNPDTGILEKIDQSLTTKILDLLSK